MSLVLVARSDNLGVICSDGRILRLYADGSTHLLTDTSPKFDVYSGTIAVATTGTSVLCRGIRQEASDFAATVFDGPGRFDAFVDFLSIRAKTLFELCPAEVIARRLSVSLLGYDARTDRIRLVSWIDDEDLQPTEHMQSYWDLSAFGPRSVPTTAVHELAQGLSAIAPFTPEKICSTMRAVIATVAEQEASIGPVSFCHIIHRPLA